MKKLFQRRTIKSPCCGKKTHVRFQYGALMIGAFCDCGKLFYLKFQEVKSEIAGFKGKRAGRLIMKTDSNTEIYMPVKKKKIKRKIIKKQKKTKEIETECPCGCGSIEYETDNKIIKRKKKNKRRKKK